MTILAEIARVRQQAGPDFRVTLVTGDYDMARRAARLYRDGSVGVIPRCDCAQDAWLVWVPLRPGTPPGVGPANADRQGREPVGTPQHRRYP